jgi:ribosome-binding factor A
MTTHRRERLEEIIRRIIGDTLLKEIKDPRIGFVTVVNVRLSRDYAEADVWISVLGDEAEKKKSLAGLESAKGYVQFVVGKNIKLRNTPRLRFHLDTSIEEGVRLVNVIDSLEKKAPAAEAAEEEEGSTEEENGE